MKLSAMKLSAMKLSAMKLSAIKLLGLLLLATPVISAQAAPVHVALKSAASVLPDADGFFTLGAVADLSGGDLPLRTRLAAVSVGRAPLDGETRQLTRGDIALKLRQAGCDPDKQAVFEGAASAEVTTVGALLAAPSLTNAAGKEGAASSAPTMPVPAAVLIHRGDAVTIVIQSGALTITAPAVARESGGAGDSIRVHRDGVMTDLTVNVIDAKTVQLEI